MVLWKERRCPIGSDEEDWFMAEMIAFDSFLRRYIEIRAVISGQAYLG